jgi:hypothetical protein
VVATAQEALEAVEQLGLRCFFVTLKCLEKTATASFGGSERLGWSEEATLLLRR